MKRVTGKAIPMPAGVGVGVTVSIVMMAVLCAVLSTMALRGIILEEMIGYGAMGVLFVSGATGAVVASVKIKRRRMLVCMLTGGVFFVSLLLMTAIFFKGQYQGVLASALAILAGSVGVGVIGIRSKPRRGKFKTC